MHQFSRSSWRSETTHDDSPPRCIDHLILARTELGRCTASGGRVGRIYLKFFERHAGRDCVDTETMILQLTSTESELRKDDEPVKSSESQKGMI
jgi:hypothetical protein